MKTEHAAVEAQWTNIDVENLLDKGGSIAVKDAHNASITAERSAKELALSAGFTFEKRCQKLRDQLAAAQAQLKLAGLPWKQDTAALDAAVEQKRLEIWRDAPDQPDIQEAVIKKLDLVHRHAIAAARQPMVDALIKIANDPNCDRCQVAVNALAKVKEGEMSAADKAQGEWTWERLHDAYSVGGWSGLVEKVNASITAEREVYTAALELANTRWIDIQKQLAAAQGALGRATDATGISFDAGTSALDAVKLAAQQPLVDALVKIANDPNCDRCQVAVDALAKAQSYQLPDGRTK